MKCLNPRHNIDAELNSIFDRHQAALLGIQKLPKITPWSLFGNQNWPDIPRLVFNLPTDPHELGYVRLPTDGSILQN
jgi:hypothetical protein